MTHVLCDECLRTYKTYTYSETIQRALAPGVDEWEGVDDKRHKNNRYYLKERRNNYSGRLYLNERGYISFRDKVCTLFPTVHNFVECNENFTLERLKKISASFLCFDCEKYLCSKCITEHSEHFTFSEDDKNNLDKWDKIETKIIQAFNTEGDTKEEYIKQVRTVLCNVVDVRDSVSEAEWEKFMSSEKEDVYWLGHKLDVRSAFYSGINTICILNDKHTFIVINHQSNHMKIYNISSNKLTGTIELPFRPAGITEIPSTGPSQSLIALSYPIAGQIIKMNIQRRPADVISSINVPGECYDLAYCNGKLITRCWDYLDGGRHYSIHVMDMSGEIINIIDVDKLTDIRITESYKMSVHPEYENIYVCHQNRSATCISLTGQVLHSTRLKDLDPCNICVDRDGRVYVMGLLLPLYRLSSDWRNVVKVIDEDAATVGWVRSIVHHKNKIYMLSMEGSVHIFSVD